ncbi:DUF6150 family protein [Burkholderiaceae bacterium UC74_6]
MVWIYQEPSFGAATLRVALVRDRGQADLCVYRAHSPGLAHGETRWFITRDRQFAHLTIHLCSLGMADLRVCFVDSPGAAGWRVPQHRCKGRLR